MHPQEETLDSYRQQLSHRLTGAEVANLATNLDSDLLLRLMAEGDTTTSRNAAWILTHLPPSRDQWLQTNQQQLMTIATLSTSDAIRRLSLTLLRRTKMTADLPPTFVDFLLRIIVEGRQPAGILSAAMHLAYDCCTVYPELNNELEATLTTAEELSHSNDTAETPATRHTRKKILQQCRNRSSQRLHM